jgi:hypothetical protein
VTRNGPSPIAGRVVGEASMQEHRIGAQRDWF